MRDAFGCLFCWNLQIPSVAWFLGIPNLTTAGPTEGALNLERVGTGTTSGGQIDLAPIRSSLDGLTPTAIIRTQGVTRWPRLSQRLEQRNVL